MNMTCKWKHFNKQKTLFKTVYCGECKQRKLCGELDQEKCCVCYFQAEQERVQEYNNYKKVLADRQKKQQNYIQQLKLLREYSGCKSCGDLSVDAYFLYDENKLVCQPCLMRKEGSATEAISFLGKSKWYKKWWGINLTEWLTQFQCLPVNASCAKEWLRDQNHLNNCQCLEKEVKELVELFTSSLKKYQERLKKCSCKKSEKFRVDYIDSVGSGWTYCEKCEAKIESAGHHGVIKNRNNPSFWWLSVSERVLCLNCLGEFREKMPTRKKYLLAEYQKREGKKKF